MSENNNPEEGQEPEVTEEETAETEEGQEVETEEAEEAPKGADGSYSEKEFKRAVERRQAALKRAQEAEKQLKELQKQHATKEQKIQMEAEEKAQAQAARFKPALVKQHVAYEMAFLGLNKTQINQILKFVEMDNIDVDLDDNTVEGVEAEVARIREIFPDLFPEPEDAPSAKAAAKKETAQKKRVPKVDAADKPAPPKPQTAMDKIAARLRKGQ